MLFIQEIPGEEMEYLIIPIWLMRKMEVLGLLNLLTETTLNSSLSTWGDLLWHWLLLLLLPFCNWGFSQKRNHTAYFCPSESISLLKFSVQSLFIAGFLSSTWSMLDEPSKQGLLTAFIKDYLSAFAFFTHRWVLKCGTAAAYYITWSQ